MTTTLPEGQQQYGSLLTVLGENAEQNGKLQNKQITFTHIAIGDANDTYVQPDRKQTGLVNELTRIPVNSVDVLQPSPDSIPMLKVEAILPDDVNDIVIREFAAVATFNDQEYFHAVGNCARIYVPKPLNNGNVSNPVTLEMIFVITSAEPIVEIDPNVITASRDWTKKTAVTRVKNLTHLRSTEGVEDGQEVRLSGFDEPGDSGEGQLYWDANATDPDDGGTCFQPYGVAMGRWKRKKKAEIVATDFGGAAAYPSSRIQAAIALAEKKRARAVKLPVTDEPLTLDEPLIFRRGGMRVYCEAGGGYPKDDDSFYITGAPGVERLIDYGNGESLSSTNQLTLSGIPLRGAVDGEGNLLTPVGFAFTQNNNGPHRGVIIRDMSAAKFSEAAVLFDPPGEVLAAASVVMENNVYTHCKFAVLAKKRILGFRYVGNQSEQGGRIAGFLDGDINIADNMLEGQDDPVDIDSNAPQLTFQRNYLEAVKGNYVVSVKTTSPSAYCQIGPNFGLDSVKSLDIYRFKGPITLDLRENYSKHKAVVTLSQAAVLAGSNLDGGSYYVDTTVPNYSAISFLPIYEYSCRNLDDYLSFLPTVEMHDQVMQTPWGSREVWESNGFEARYRDINFAVKTGDLVVCNALIRVEIGDDEIVSPTLSLYSEEDFSLVCSAGQVILPPRYDSAWLLMTFTRPALAAATALKFRFGPNGQHLITTHKIQVAALSIRAVDGENLKARELIRPSSPL